jgi:hypothetical protein
MEISEKIKTEKTHVMSATLSHHECDQFIAIYENECPEETKIEMKVNWAINHILRKKLNSDPPVMNDFIDIGGQQYLINRETKSANFLTNVKTGEKMHFYNDNCKCGNCAFGRSPEKPDDK